MFTLGRIDITSLREWCALLSLFLLLSIKEIAAIGRVNGFPRPLHCLRGGCESNRIWGHGYVDAFFYGYDSAVALRRYRCADCGCVYTIRPAECWPRHRTPIMIILTRLAYRVKEGVWDTGNGLTRQMQGNWLRALKRNIKTYLGVSYVGSLIEGFHELIATERIPVLRLQ